MKKNNKRSNSNILTLVSGKWKLIISWFPGFYVIPWLQEQTNKQPHHIFKSYCNHKIKYTIRKKKMYFTCNFKKWLLNIETFHLIYFLLLHCRKNLIELYLGYSVIHKYYLSYKSYSDFYCSCLLQKSLSIFFAVETCNKMVITGKASHLAVKPTEKWTLQHLFFTG